MEYKTKKIICIILIVIMLLSFFLQIAVDGISNAGFYIIFGFGGAWLTVLFAKAFLAKILQKEEDYYDKEDAEL